MARLNLEAKNPAQALILQYLEQNASESLAERINAGKHTLNDCFKYISDQAKTRAVNGVAAIVDRQVFGWAIHYFEEDGHPTTEPKAEDYFEPVKAFDVSGPKPVRIVREAKKEEPTPEQPKKAERVIVPKKPRIPETTKPKKADAEQITGQTSIFDFI